MQQPYNTEGNKILEELLREPSDLRLFDEKWVRYRTHRATSFDR